MRIFRYFENEVTVITQFEFFKFKVHMKVLITFIQQKFNKVSIRQAHI